MTNQNAVPSFSCFILDYHLAFGRDLPLIHAPCDLQWIMSLFSSVEPISYMIVLFHYWTSCIRDYHMSMDYCGCSILTPVSALSLWISEVSPQVVTSLFRLEICTLHRFCFLLARCVLMQRMALSTF
jgi:hypothetical protein